MRGRAIFLLALLALAAVLVTDYLRHRTAERNSDEYTGQVGQATEGHGPGFVALDSATIGRIGLKTTALISGRAVSARSARGTTFRNRASLACLRPAGSRGGGGGTGLRRQASDHPAKR